MPSYRTATFGMVEASVLDPSLKMITDAMKIYLGSATNFEYMCSPRVVSDLVKMFKTITGDDFRSWLAANYNQGTGVRANLVRSILSFLNGHISGMMLSDAITRDQRKLVAYANAESDPVVELTRHIADEHHLNKWVGLLEEVTNYDTFRLIEGIGYVSLAKLVCTLQGDPADV